MRISIKGDEAARALTGQLDQSVRRMAVSFAESRGAEFADADDVRNAYRAMIETIAKAFAKLDAQTAGSTKEKGNV